MRKLLIDITYRDDKKERFECVDYPSMGEYITIYLPGLRREYIKSETVQRMKMTVK